MGHYRFVTAMMLLLFAAACPAEAQTRIGSASGYELVIVTAGASGTLTLPAATDTLAIQSQSVPLYNVGGSVLNYPHAVQWSCTLSAGSCTITLAGSAVYSSSSSYVCTGNDGVGAVAAVSTQNQTASSFKVFGTSSDNVAGICIGN